MIDNFINTLHAQIQLTGRNILSAYEIIYDCYRFFFFPRSSRSQLAITFPCRRGRFLKRLSLDWFTSSAN